MNRIIMMTLLTRQSTVKKQQIHSAVRLLNKNESSSSDSSDSDNEKPKKKPGKKVVAKTDEESKKQTSVLLNSLLTKMSTRGPETAAMNRAIPNKKPLPKPVPKPTLEEKLVGAAKDVAVSLGGDVKETEDALLNKVFSAGTPTPTPTLTTTPTSTTPESTKADSSGPKLRDLLTGMHIDRNRTEKPDSDVPHNPYRNWRLQAMAKKFGKEAINYSHTNRSRSRTVLIPGGLYAHHPLNIFEPAASTLDDSPKLKTWELLDQDYLKLLLTHSPENIFEEMIQWTERGILWKFPIDNEIGMEEEQNIHFSEHVFMERHLHGWCPKKGPIRHFMELVCVGLSKNPYMTVQEKKNHIMWYQDFFSSKQELLTEVGAIESHIPPSNSTKQIDA